jgi:GABA(A) receptor-associated protein
MTTPYTTYKNQFPIIKRKKEALRILRDNPDRVPVIVEKHSSPDTPMISDRKFLVPLTFTVGQFMHLIRQRMTLKPEQALFLFINEKTIPPTSALISQLYKEYKDTDGYLTFTYCIENTFG